MDSNAGLQKKLQEWPDSPPVLFRSAAGELYVPGKVELVNDKDGECVIIEEADYGVA